MDTNRLMDANILIDTGNLIPSRVGISVLLQTQCRHGDDSDSMESLGEDQRCSSQRASVNGVRVVSNLNTHTQPPT